MSCVPNIFQVPFVKNKKNEIDRIYSKVIVTHKMRKYSTVAEKCIWVGLVSRTRADDRLSWNFEKLAPVHVRRRKQVCNRIRVL